MKTLVVLEVSTSGLKRSSLEAIGAAYSISDGSEVMGIVFGSHQAVSDVAGKYGLSQCLVVEGNEWSSQRSSMLAAAIAEAAQKVDANAVIFAANAFGKAVAPRVAVRLEAGMLADCVDISVVEGRVQARRPVYSGKATVAIAATTAKSVLTLRPNVFTAKEQTSLSVNIQTFQPSTTNSVRTSVVTGHTANEGSLDVAEADIVVSGGRGLKGPENFHIIENLAKSLGAAVGASRAVVDAGWRPHREQVGQTGKTVSPTMYVACGISGAVQHLAGMSSSKVIVAVNKDKDAPIFTVADYGIIGDVFEVLPKLTSAIASVTGKG